MASNQPQTAAPCHLGVSPWLPMRFFSLAPALLSEVGPVGTGSCLGSLSLPLTHSLRPNSNVFSVKFSWVFLSSLRVAQTLAYSNASHCPVYNGPLLGLCWPWKSLFLIPQGLLRGFFGSIGRTDSHKVWFAREKMPLLGLGIE